MSLRWAPVTLALAAGGCSAVIFLASAGSPARVGAALLLGLVLPGMAIVGSPAGRGHVIETLLLALGTSIAVLVLDSSLLYVLGVRLDSASWGWSLGAITVLSATVRFLRGSRDGARSGSGKRSRADRGRPRLAAPAAVAVLVALILAATALITGHSVAQRSRSDHFTQLWALPMRSTAGRITVGLYNHQGNSRRYSVRLHWRGRFIDRWTVRLRPGQRWAMTVRGVPSNGPVLVSALSTRPGRVYRWVELRLRNAEG